MEHRDNDEAVAGSGLFIAGSVILGFCAAVGFICGILALIAGDPLILLAVLPSGGFILLLVGGVNQIIHHQRRQRDQLLELQALLGRRSPHISPLMDLSDPDGPFGAQQREPYTPNPQP